MINRKLRRKLNKGRKEKFTDADFAYMDSFMIGAQKSELVEGEKVRINHDNIMANPMWKDYNPHYKEFVESNFDTIFTVEFENEKQKNNQICVLKEDESEVKWIFNSFELIKITENKENNV